MLPIKEWEGLGSTAQFNRAMNPPMKGGGVYLPITPTLLGLAIGQAIQNRGKADAAVLADAMAASKFDPESTLRKAIRAQLDRSSLNVQLLNSSEVSAKVRSNDFKDLPTDVDAILDIQIYSVGYYPIGKNIGFSPQFQLSARLVDTINRGEIIDDFSYSGSHEKSDGTDSRYFETPVALSQPTIAAFEGNADIIHKEFSKIFEKVAEKLVDDIVRVRDKLPHLE